MAIKLPAVFQALLKMREDILATNPSKQVEDAENFLPGPSDAKTFLENVRKNFADDSIQSRAYDDLDAVAKRNYAGQWVFPDGSILRSSYAGNSLVATGIPATEQSTGVMPPIVAAPLVEEQLVERAKPAEDEEQKESQSFGM